MGYNTDFSGELKFTSKLSTKQLEKVKTFLQKDCREHPEWNRTDLTWIDLELLEDERGLQWDGSEKTYDLTEKVNLIIDEMRKEFPKFGLEGELQARGEGFDDNWFLVIEKGKAQRKEAKIVKS